MIKVVRLTTSEASWHWPSQVGIGHRKLALVVVVDDGLWKIFKFNGRRPQRWLLNLINLSKAGVVDDGYCLN